MHAINTPGRAEPNTPSPSVVSFLAMSNKKNPLEGLEHTKSILSSHESRPACLPEKYTIGSSIAS